MNSPKIIFAFALTNIIAITLLNSVQADENKIEIRQVGNKNQVYIRQTSSRGGVGGANPNRSLINNYDAQSFVGSFTLDAIVGNAILNTNEPTIAEEGAVQRGFGNFADINISGYNGYVYLSQSQGNSISAENSANITISGQDSTAEVKQVGFKNDSTITIEGALSTASILQTGDFNVGSLDVPSDETEALLVQNGNSNMVNLNVIGVNGTSVSYTLNGNNITQPGIQIITNSTQPIQITQQ